MERKLRSELDLSCGHVKIFQLYGRDARDMMRCMSGGGDSTEALEILATRCAVIGGDSINLQTLEEMPFEDYLELMKAIQVNFTPMEPKES